MSFLQAADTIVPALALGQMIGRWGNFFNREAFGGYTDNLFAMQLPAGDVRASEITREMSEHMQKIGDVLYVQVHPTFLYESLWNLGVFLILMFLTFRIRSASRGTAALWYLLLYGTGRFWIEGLRTDQLLLTGTSIPVSQLLSAVLAAAAAVCLVIKRITRNTAAVKGTKEYESKRDTGGKD